MPVRNGLRTFFCTAAAMAFWTASTIEGGEWTGLHRAPVQRTPEVMMAAPLVPLGGHGPVAPRSAQLGTNLGVHEFPWGYFGAQPATMGCRHTGYHETWCQLGFRRGE